MAKDFAKKFYSSYAWKSCRATYKKQVGYLCERCLAKGIIRTGDELHHLIVLTPDNIDDPNITLNFDNLILLCHDCHMEMHHEAKPKRFSVDEFGNITAIF